MICPNCGHDNVPGSEECAGCRQDLSQLDRPHATNHIERSLMQDPVGRLCHQRPIIVKPTATLHHAMQAMLVGGVGAVLVVDDAGQLVGILSERDLLSKVAGQHDNYLKLPVQDFMTAQPETVSGSDTLAFALHKMDVGGYRHLPVVKNGRPEGVVSVRDLLRHITRLCKDS
jgi:CBS domain-containing protein